MRGVMAAVGLVFACTTPWFKKSGWRRFYQYLATIRPNEFRCMNYGFADSEPIELEASEEHERFGLQLYHHVASAVDIRDREVLEIGCGRGGGLNYVKKYLKPKKATGLDLSANAVALARRRFGTEGLEFVTGDAGNLPFAADSFDCVINVESAFCYPSRQRFYKEVHRVLRTGGHFLYADIIEKKSKVDLLNEELERIGFTLIRKETINSNVTRALDLDSARRKEAIDSMYRFFPIRFAIYVFTGVKDSFVYKQIRSGNTPYICYAARKGTHTARTCSVTA